MHQRLPDRDGIEFIRDLRGWSAIPVIVLSARTAEAEKVAALDAGAHDYLTKPFGAGEPLHLTPIEYRLLAYLVANPDCVLTHRQLLKNVWGPTHVGDSHYVRVYMGQLRKKIEADPSRPRHILTEAGVGYRFVA